MLVKKRVMADFEYNKNSDEIRTTSMRMKTVMKMKEMKQAPV